MRNALYLMSLMYVGHAAAQTTLGAGAGWSHSKPHAQGGPLLSVICEQRWNASTTRSVIDAQVPSTVQSSFSDPGDGRMLSAGYWTDGHQRVVMTSTTLSMISVGIDHLFIIDSDRPEDRLDLRLGPGVGYAAEQLGYDSRIEDRTTDSTVFTRTERSRGAMTVRATMGAAYHLPYGELLIEACSELLTFEGQGNGTGGSAWFQRQLFRIGAVFPIGKKSAAAGH